MIDSQHITFRIYLIIRYKLIKALRYLSIITCRIFILFASYRKYLVTKGLLIYPSHLNFIFLNFHFTVSAERRRLDILFKVNSSASTVTITSEHHQQLKFLVTEESKISN